MKNKRFSFQSLLFFLATALMCGGLSAHEDRMIPLKGTKLTGLPEEYAPAEFDPKTLRLRIGKREMKFTPFLRSLFDTPHDLTFSASWYHDSRTLPPYLLLRIRPKKRDFHYELLFNLDSLQLLNTSVALQESETTSRVLGIEMSAEDKAAIRAAIKTLK